MIIPLILILLWIVFIAGCTMGPIKESVQQGAINNCIKECNSELEEGIDLSNGPCLSNSIAPGYVCDVAHDPRQPVDDLSENQCSAYRNGTASHFVEVDENCNLIKAI